MTRELLQARCDPDTVEQVEQYADDKNISRSESMRRLLRAGIRSKGYGSDQEGEQHVMGQMNAQRIAYIALLILSFGLGVTLPL